MMTSLKTTPEIQTVINVWQPFIASITDWQTFVEMVAPKATGCGPVYEPLNPLDRPNESFAIADMRGIQFAQPHYHSNGEVEIYFILEGTGRVVVGGQVQNVKKGSVLSTPSGTTHYAIPDKEQGLVMVVINTPPFNGANNIEVTESDQKSGYDHAQFISLTQSL